MHTHLNNRYKTNDIIQFNLDIVNISDFRWQWIVLDVMLKTAHFLEDDLICCTKEKFERLKIAVVKVIGLQGPCFILSTVHCLS